MERRAEQSDPQAKRARRVAAAGASNGAQSAFAVAPSADGAGAVCCGCHDTLQNGQPANLVGGRFLCAECLETVACYVCGGRRAPGEERELLRCAGCTWRGAHALCLGYAARGAAVGAAPAPTGPWYCFRCADGELARREQARSVPVLDARAHHEYLAHVARSTVGSQEKGEDDDEEASGRPAPDGEGATVWSDAACVPAGRRLQHALGRAGLPGGSLPPGECPHCACPSGSPRNFCSCCGLPLAPVVLPPDVLKGPERAGGFVLGTVVTPAGKRMTLLCNRQRTLVRWMADP